MINKMIYRDYWGAIHSCFSLQHCCYGEKHAVNLDRWHIIMAIRRQSPVPPMRHFLPGPSQLAGEGGGTGDAGG